MNLAKIRDAPDISPGFREIPSLSLMILPLLLLSHTAAAFPCLLIVHHHISENEEGQIPKGLPWWWWLVNTLIILVVTHPEMVASSLLNHWSFSMRLLTQTPCLCYSISSFSSSSYPHFLSYFFLGSTHQCQIYQWYTYLSRLLFGLPARKEAPRGQVFYFIYFFFGLCYLLLYPQHLGESVNKYLLHE